MPVMKAGYFLMLLFLGVSSDDATQKAQSPRTRFAKLSKLSEFFIGDLLRTDAKEHLETSSSVVNPISTTEHTKTELIDNIPDSSRVIANYDVHGGHDYSDEEPQTESSDVGSPKRVPVNVREKYTIRQAGMLERNVMSSEGNNPTGRYERQHDHRPYDCKRHQQSSSEEAYSDEGRSHRASRSRDYGNTPSSYHPEDGHYVSSHGSSSSQPSNSKSYASKSQSATSHSSSKSSSKSDNRPKKVHVFEVVKPSHHGNYQNGHGNSGGVVVHKLRDTSDSEEDSYSDEGPVREANHHSDAEPVTQYYDDYPTQTPGYQRPKVAVHNQRPEYSHRPPSYKNGRYENPASHQIKQHSYNGPPAYHSQGHSQYPHAREQTPNYRESPHVPRPSPQTFMDGRSLYSSQGNRHQYRQEPYLQSSRQRNGRPQLSHSKHPSETAHASPEYENKRHIIRPSEATTEEYGDNTTPYSNGQATRDHIPRRKFLPRDARSQYPPQPVVEGRTENPLIVVTRASDPTVSRSVSYSESTYPSRTIPKAFAMEQQPRNFEEPQKMTNPLHPNGNQQGRGYQTPYKPYNSDYPASYGDGQGQYNSGDNSEDQSYENPHQEPHGYHDSQQQYDGPHGEYDSSEQEDGYGHHESPKTEGDITGYKETYGDSKPLEIDDAFFEKYGISKKAKVIFATAMQPNLFVADGTHLKEGGGSNDGPSEEYHERTQNAEKERHPAKPKRFSTPIKVPGSFTELVDSNPKFLRQLSATSRRSTAEEFPDHDPTLDDLVFQSGFGDPKAFVKSQGTRELVQEHGNGMSRIIFNHPTDLSKAEAFENEDNYEEKSESRVVGVLEKPKQKQGVESANEKKSS